MHCSVRFLHCNLFVLFQINKQLFNIHTGYPISKCRFFPIQQSCYKVVPIYIVLLKWTFDLLLLYLCNFDRQSMLGQNMKANSYLINNVIEVTWVTENLWNLTLAKNRSWNQITQILFQSNFKSNAHCRRLIWVA